MKQLIKQLVKSSRFTSAASCFALLCQMSFVSAALPNDHPDPNDLVGLWVVPSGDAIVEVGLHKSRLSLTLKRSFDSQLKDINNPDARLRDRPLVGLKLGRQFEETKKGWQGGKLYDPASGKTYKASLKLNDQDQLELRAYIGLPALGQTQTWTRLGQFKTDMLTLLSVEACHDQ